MDTKLWVNTPERYRQIGRHVDRDDDHTPTDVQHFLFNKRMHERRHYHFPQHLFTKLHVRHVLHG